MTADLIPASLKRRFQESYGTYSVLRNIELDYSCAGLTKADLAPGTAPSGARRRLVEQYFQGVDWADHEDISRILGVGGPPLAA